MSKYGDSVQAHTGAGEEGALVAGIPNNRESDPNQPAGQEAVINAGVQNVPAGSSFTLSWTTATTIRLRCASIPQAIASLFRITSWKCGDREYILGTTQQVTGLAAPTLIQGVRGENFNEFSQCANVIADCCIKPGKPMTVQATNISVAPADFEVVSRGEKLPEECP